jgi:hypothetical protein
MFLLGLIVGVVLTIVMIAGFALFVGGEESTDELEHYHDWQVRGAHQLFRVHTYHGVPLQPIEEGAPITEVLYRCSCGDLTTETLDGHWTYEQLSGVAGSGETVTAEEGQADFPNYPEGHPLAPKLPDSGDTIAQAVEEAK